MIGKQPDNGPELQRLAQTILAMLDPLVQAGAAVASAAADAGAPGKCTQVWCPVCAVAAVASDQQHPLTSVIDEHGVALLALIHSIAKPKDPEPPDDPARGEPAEQSPHPPSGYQPIVVTIHE